MHHLQGTNCGQLTPAAPHPHPPAAPHPHPSAGTNPTDFQSTKADAMCAQLLRLTGDAEATCKVVYVASVTGRRLLQVRRGKGWELRRGWAGVDR